MRKLGFVICNMITAFWGSFVVGSESLLPTCEGSPISITEPAKLDEMRNIWNNCHVDLIVPNFGRYIGAIQNGSAHGKGVMYYYDQHQEYAGGTYEGSWAQDTWHGEGTFTSEYGSQKTGTWNYAELLDPSQFSTKILKSKADEIQNLVKKFGLTIYGNFLHSKSVPNALFLFSEIEDGDSFLFQKALQEQKIHLLALASPGGFVAETLDIAEKIYENKINTYVPQRSVHEKSICGSSCAFMFLAGETRSVEGALGVHQFNFNRATDLQKPKITDQHIQNVIYKIISALNKFQTPPWVFERMFKQSDMYFFKPPELLLLGTEVSDDLKADYENSEKFITDFSKAFEEAQE